MFTKKEIADIAESLDAGFNCYVHRVNKSVIQIPEFAMNEDSDHAEFWKEDMDKIENDEGSYVKIPRMNSNESFRLMENFVRTVDDIGLRQRLIRALNERKPIANFKHHIDNSGPYRQRWFDFKKQELIERVKDILEVNELYSRPQEEESASESEIQHPGKETGITAEQVEQMELRLIEAIKRSDVKFLERILHDQLLAMAPDGKIITKELDLQSHRAGEMVVDELHASLDEISIVNDTAIAGVVYETKGKMLGRPIAGKFKYLRVWKKFDDGLKVIAASCLKL